LEQRLDPTRRRILPVPTLPANNRPSGPAKQFRSNDHHESQPGRMEFGIQQLFLATLDRDAPRRQLDAASVPGNALI
jgi:hypothetical protein